MQNSIESKYCKPLERVTVFMRLTKSFPLVISLLFVFGLSISLMPATVWAEEDEEDEEVKYQFLEDGTADLGTYHIKIFDSILRKTLNVSFELLGAVNFEDKDKFMEYMDRRYYQLRELVNTSIRTCTLDELTDSTHHILKRKIISRVNRVFGWKFLDLVEPINFRLVQWSIDEGMVPIPLRPMPKKSDMKSVPKATQ